MAGIFAVVAGVAVWNFVRGAAVLDQLHAATPQTFAHVRFTKDPLRASEGLDVQVTEPADLEALVGALRTLTKSGVSLKSLKTTHRATLVLSRDGEDPLALDVIRAEGQAPRFRAHPRSSLITPR